MFKADDSAAWKTSIASLLMENAVVFNIRQDPNSRVMHENAVVFNIRQDPV